MSQENGPTHLADLAAAIQALTAKIEPLAEIRDLLNVMPASDNVATLVERIEGLYEKLDNLGIQVEALTAEIAHANAHADANIGADLHAHGITDQEMAEERERLTRPEER
jgi:outer membrane murein-binding lipoprotein Lpp